MLSYILLKIKACAIKIEHLNGSSVFQTKVYV